MDDLNANIENATPEQLREAVRKMMAGLCALGFNADEPIDGGDAVEAVAVMFDDVTNRILA